MAWHLRHYGLLGVKWAGVEAPEFPGVSTRGECYYHGQNQHLTDRSIVVRDVRFACIRSDLCFYRVDATFTFGDNARVHLSKVQPEEFFNNGYENDFVHDPTLFSFSAGGFKVRRDRYSLELFAGPHSEYHGVVTAVRVPAYWLLLLGGGPVGYQIVKLVRSRVERRHRSARGFDIVAKSQTEQGE